MREINNVKFDSGHFSDRNMVMNFNVLDPATINSNLTYLWGHDSDRFPLLTLTQGQGAITTKKRINGPDTQYKWHIATRRRVTSRLKRLLTNTTTPGIGRTGIEVEMVDNWFIYQHHAISPSGLEWRIQNEGIQQSTGGYLYRFFPLWGDDNRYAPMSDFTTNAVWALGASSVPTSKSDGNRSNNQAPFQATNQYGVYRFSKAIAGNMAGLVTNIEFKLADGSGTTNLWMPYEMREWELRRREQLEEDLWFSEYNRDENGVIKLIDEHTGENVPRGAGVKDILKGVGNHETFTPHLTLQRLDRIISRIFDARIDTTIDELILYCGQGFAKLFHKAILRDARLNNYFVTLGNNEIGASDNGWMSYGKYFNRYKMFNGKILTVKCVDVFDHGIRADRDREAGNMYDGYPIMSYNAVFMDHSVGMNGERNITYVCEEGREYEVGIYKGMAKIPQEWQYANNLTIVDRQDIATYEVLGTQGINITNPTTSFWLEPDFDFANIAA